MKSLHIIICLLALSHYSIKASVVSGIPDPQKHNNPIQSNNNPDQKEFIFPSIGDKTTTKVFTISKEDRAKFITPHITKFKKITADVRKIGEPQLIKEYGPETSLDDSYVIPLTGFSGVGFSGLGYTGNGRYYFLKVADIGALIIFPYGNGKSISAAALYLKKDDQYIDVTRPEELKTRVNWEQQRLQKIHTLINQLGEQDAAPNLRPR